MNRALSALLALGLLAAPAAARPDEAAEARTRFRKGAELYAAGKWREAIAEFEAAYRAKPHGAIHFNVAQCREKLAEWPGAHRAYADYLREVPDAKDRAAVRAAMRKIETRLAAAGVQALLVYTDPPGAEVRLDGTPHGKTPVQLVVPPRTYVLSLALDLYDPVQQEIALAPDAARTVDLVLRPSRPPPAPAPAAAAPAAGAPSVPAPPPAGPATPATGTAAPAASAATAGKAEPSAKDGKAAADLSVKPPSPAVPAGPAPARKKEERKRLYTWIAAGVAGAALAAGAYYGYSAAQDEDALKSMTQADGDAARRYASDARSKARTANALYAVGGAAAAAGVTLFFVEKRF